MKSKLFFITLTTTLFLSSCTTEMKLNGAWLLEASVSRYTFRDDGTYEIYSTEYNVVQYNGTWSVENDGKILVLSQTCGGNPGAIKYTITWEDSDHFSITPQSGTGACTPAYVSTYTFKFYRQ